MHVSNGLILSKSGTGIFPRLWQQNHSNFLRWRTIRKATHAAQGRANGPKNGPGQRLGAKKTGDEYVVPGNIIFRQRGTLWFPGENVGMGRDHTIFALQPGFVKYYRNPQLHPRRRYIGVVFEKAHSLPSSLNAPRNRRLGFITVPRAPHAKNTVSLDGKPDDYFNSLAQSNIEAPFSLNASRLDPLTTNEVPEIRRRKATGRIASEKLQMWPDYSYRESNWDIGRAAERAEVRSYPYKKGNRFLAWRTRAVRRSVATEKRAIGKSRGGTKGKSRAR